MFEQSPAFFRASRDARQGPEVLFSLANAFGVRVYASAHPRAQAVGLVAAAPADGGYLADGGRHAGLGDQPLLDQGAKLLALGALRETLSPLSGQLVASLTQEEPGSLSAVLCNADGHFARLEARENLLGAVCELKVGYPGLPAREYLARFRGEVGQYVLEPAQVTLKLRAL